MSKPPEPILTSGNTYQVEQGQQLTLIRKGSELVLKVGIRETQTTIPQDGTLILNGPAGPGSRLTIETPGISPRIVTQTQFPLLIDGSFIAAEGSSQVALVDSTPVGLTNMKGVSKSSDRYNISTSNKHLEAHLPDEEFPKGAKTLAFGGPDGKRRIIAVEPGARVDFVNSQEGNQPLFTLDGSEAMETTQMRFMQAQYNAVDTVRNVLGGNLGEDAFDNAKDRAGLPQKLKHGVVNFSEIGAVDMGIRAVADEYIGVPVKAVTVEATDADKSLLSKIDGAMNVYTKHAQPIFDGRYDFLGKGENNKGVILGKALEDVSAATKEVINEENHGVRPQMLAKLHAQLDRVEQISSEIAEQMGDEFKGYDYKGTLSHEGYVAYYAHSIRDRYNKLHDELNASEALRDNRVGTVPAEKKHGFMSPEHNYEYAGAVQPATLQESLLASLAKQVTGEGYDMYEIAHVEEHGGMPSTPQALDKKNNSRAA